jgi:DNA-binding NarL/FixJ family response regulator
MTSTLIVEDNPSFRQTLKNILITEFPSMDIHEASNAEEAWMKIQAEKPEIIFMDIRLPGENGIQLTRRIQAAQPEIIILVISNCDSVEYENAAIDAGAKAFISKASSSPLHIIETISAIFPL